MAKVAFPQLASKSVVFTTNQLEACEGVHVEITECVWSLAVAGDDSELNTLVVVVRPTAESVNLPSSPSGQSSGNTSIVQPPQVSTSAIDPNSQDGVSPSDEQLNQNLNANQRAEGAIDTANAPVEPNIIDSVAVSSLPRSPPERETNTLSATDGTLRAPQPRAESVPNTSSSTVPAKSKISPRPRPDRETSDAEEPPTKRQRVQSLKVRLFVSCSADSLLHAVHYN